MITHSWCEPKCSSRRIKRYSAFSIIRQTLTLVVLVAFTQTLFADYVPDPIMLVHGRNSSFEGDWNSPELNKLSGLLVDLYPEGQKNVFGYSIVNVNGRAASWLSEYSSVSGGLLPSEATHKDVVPKLSWFEEARRQYLFTHPDGVPAPGTFLNGAGYSDGDPYGIPEV